MTVVDTLALDIKPPPGGQVLHDSDRATVIWGDCRDPQVIAQVPDGYGLLCTDPPYGVRYNSGRSRTFTEIPGDDGAVDWPTVLAEWVGPEGTCTRGLKDARHVYVFGYSEEQLAGPLRLGATADLVWDKTQVGMGRLDIPWGPQHERITMGVHTKRRSGRDRGDGQAAARMRRGTVLRYPRANASSAVRHPNEKPWRLVAELIESSTVRAHRTQDSDLVVDPCAGSGSTGVAAVLSGRRCFLVEVTRSDAELAVERVQAVEHLVKQMEAL
ncbi:DNA-methyltransferase [Streptomyces pseudovenezuelae]|uniref:DNA-methyltransferase n=1 Tax=Streptomyces pseudovenezuelae TaxID=67350 RepID=UPI002E82038B|nr:DNA methyltransferase [Streptomyces pseudovenezuelae]WUA94510.1 site-specific DNA-methyltransferase [Streptomyces pseudovenezuelae]